MHREGFVQRFRAGRTGGSSRRIGRVTVLLFVLALVLSSQVAALAGGTTTGDKFLMDGPASTSIKAVEPMAEVELPGGGMVEFVPIANERGAIEGVMVAETIGARMQSMRSVEGMITRSRARTMARPRSRPTGRVRSTTALTTLTTTS